MCEVSIGVWCVVCLLRLKKSPWVRSQNLPVWSTGLLCLRVVAHRFWDLCRALSFLASTDMSGSVLDDLPWRSYYFLQY